MSGNEISRRKQKKIDNVYIYIEYRVIKHRVRTSVEYLLRARVFSCLFIAIFSVCMCKYVHTNMYVHASGDIYRYTVL